MPTNAPPLSCQSAVLILVHYQQNVSPAFLCCDSPAGPAVLIIKKSKRWWGLWENNVTGVCRTTVSPPDMRQTMLPFIILELTSSFAAVVVTMATRGRLRTRNVNMCRIGE